MEVNDLEVEEDLPTLFWAEDVCVGKWRSEQAWKTQIFEVQT